MICKPAKIKFFVNFHHISLALLKYSFSLSWLTFWRFVIETKNMTNPKVLYIFLSQWKWSKHVFNMKLRFWGNRRLNFQTRQKEFIIIKKGFSHVHSLPKKSSIRLICDRGSSINWSPFTNSNCSRGNISSHRTEKKEKNKITSYVF